MNKREERRRHTRCSFCGKSQDQVKKLVAGPGVYICDQCVALCNEVIAGTPLAAPPTERTRSGWIRRLRAGLRPPWSHRAAAQPS